MLAINTLLELLCFCLASSSSTCLESVSLSCFNCSFSACNLLFSALSFSISSDKVFSSSSSFSGDSGVSWLASGVPPSFSRFFSLVSESSVPQSVFSSDCSLFIVPCSFASFSISISSGISLSSFSSVLILFTSAFLFAPTETKEYSMICTLV